MDAQTEQKLLSTLYDRLFDMITFKPAISDAPAALDRAKTMIHLSKSEVVREGQFDNMRSPSNPEGDLGQAEAFAAMVDILPFAKTEFVARAGTSISDAYTRIVNGANATTPPNVSQEQLYKQADEYLNTYTEVRDFRGNVKRSSVPSDVYKNYQDLQTQYFTAVGKYRATLGNHNMNNHADQEAWQAEAPGLENAMTVAYENWRSSNADLVEEALAAKASTMNSAVRQAIASAQQRVSQPLASQVTGGSPWLMSYAIPDGWSGSAVVDGFSDLTLSTSNLNTSASSEYTSYGGGGSWGAGLWSVGGGFDSTDTAEHHHMDSDTFELHAKIGVIEIMRPWFDAFLFGLSGWTMDGVAPGGISKGNLSDVDECLLPLVPVSLIVARDITITSHFGAEDTDRLTHAFSSSASVGWGPFSVSGHYSHSTSQEDFHAHFEDGKLIVPGIQILGRVSSVLPHAPR